MSRPPIPLSIMYFPFLLTIQLAVCSLAKPIEDGSMNEYDTFPALSDLIPDPSHGWTQTVPNFYQHDSQSQIVSQSQPNSRPLWASLKEDRDVLENTFTSAEGSPCRAGRDGIHRRDGESCTLDRKIEGAKDGAQEGAQQGASEGAAQGAREGEGAQKEGTAQTGEETPTIAPVWTPPDIYDPNWRKELDESMENMKRERERNQNLPWDDSTRCGDKWSFIPTTYSLHVCCDGVAMGAGIYLEVDNCDWRAFLQLPTQALHLPLSSCSHFYLSSQFTPRRAAQGSITSVVKCFW